MCLFFTKFPSIPRFAFINYVKSTETIKSISGFTNKILRSLIESSLKLGQVYNGATNTIHFMCNFNYCYFTQVFKIFIDLRDKQYFSNI